MKIVVRETNWIGDAVMSIPALNYLRRIFPDSHISLYTPSWSKELFQEAEFIDEVISFKKEKNSIYSVRKQAKEWRKSEFDLAILFTNSFQTALTAKLGNANSRFGYSNEFRSFLLTNPIAKPEWKNEKHEAYYYINLISEVEKYYFNQTTFNQKELIARITISTTLKQKARKLLQSKGITTDKTTIALGVGSTNSNAKRWGAKKYAELNDTLQKAIGSNVILLGSSNELDITKQVIEYSDFNPISFTGETSLAEAIGVLSEVDMLVSNDMGLAHIAPAVGTKTLTIFGPTNPKTTKPIGAEIIRNKVDCVPCMLRECPIDHPCMIELSPDSVFNKVINMLNK